MVDELLRAAKGRGDILEDTDSDMNRKPRGVLWAHAVEEPLCAQRLTFQLSSLFTLGLTGTNV